MVALCLGLVARGHSVSLAVPPNLLDFARSYGLDAFPVGLDYEQVAKRAAHGSFREVMGVAKSLRAEVRVQLDALFDRASGCQLLVGSSVFAVGELLSQKLGIPYAFFAFCPQLFPSGEHPSPTTPWQTMHPWLNRLSWTFNDWNWRWLLLSALNEARAGVGLLPVKDVWTALIGKHPFVASDSALAPAPPDAVEALGLRQLPALTLEDPSPLSASVRAFLEAGPPPVYIGFGSMADPDPARTTARLLESVRLAGVRALISRGWAGLRAEETPPGVLFVGPEPHRKLFPHCAAVVHHGGAGTTHAAARAGVPQVPMPQLLDQHYWAQRLKSLGVSPGQVARHGKDPRPLAEALRACVEESHYRDEAKRTASVMRDDGTAQAVMALEAVANHQRGAPAGAEPPSIAADGRAGARAGPGGVAVALTSQS